MLIYFRNLLVAISAIIMLTLIYMLASCEFVHAKGRTYALSNKGRQTLDTINHRKKQFDIVVNLPSKTAKLAKELRFDAPKTDLDD